MGSIYTAMQVPTQKPIQTSTLNFVLFNMKILRLESLKTVKQVPMRIIIWVLTWELRQFPKHLNGRLISGINMKRVCMIRLFEKLRNSIVVFHIGFCICCLVWITQEPIKIPTQYPWQVPTLFYITFLCLKLLQTESQIPVQIIICRFMDGTHVGSYEGIHSIDM